MADNTFTPSLTGPMAAFADQPTPGGRLDVSAIDQNLTLANGMTAGYGVFDNHYDNWPLGYPGAPNHYGSWRLQPKRVGFLRNIANVFPGPSNNQSGQYTLYFMYNPNEIDVSWQMSQGGFSPLYLYGANVSSAFSDVQGYGQTNQQSIPAYANQQQVHWVLYFDRTYDMMYGTDGAGSGAEDDRGVLKDVAALYNLLGAFQTDAAVPISVPCRVVFGQNHDGQLWGFTGYINATSIQYGVFRHDMIPSMAEVDLTMMCTYVGDQTPAGAAPPSGSVNGSSTPPPPPFPANAPPTYPYKGPLPYGPVKTPQTTNPSGLPGSQLTPVTGQPGAKTPSGSGKQPLPPGQGTTGSFPHPGR